MADLSTRSVMLVLHDVAPETWPAYESFVAQIDSIGGVPITWLVVPDFHKRNPMQSAPSLQRLLNERLAQGDELVLHGFHHCDDGSAPRNPRDYFMRRIYTWEGEFYSLSEAQAFARLESGLDLFNRMGWPLHGFVAPAWLMSRGTRRALARLPLTYTSDAGHFYRLPDFTPINAPGIVWSTRSPWRRGLSRVYSALREQQLRDAQVIRLGLHPEDMRHPLSRNYWLEMLKRSLAQGRKPTTKIDWLRAQASFSDSPAGSQGCSSRQSCAAPSKSAPLSGVNSSGS
jgi:predicted deacetylase